MARASQVIPTYSIFSLCAENCSARYGQIVQLACCDCFQVKRPAAGFWNGVWIDPNAWLVQASSRNFVLTAVPLVDETANQIGGWEGGNAWSWPGLSAETMARPRGTTTWVRFRVDLSTNAPPTFKQEAHHQVGLVKTRAT